MLARLIIIHTMEDSFNSSPTNLNPQNASTSPFLNDFSFKGEGLSLGENIFSKKIEEEIIEEPKVQIKEEVGIRRRINDFDGEILSKYSDEGLKKLSFAGKLQEFFRTKKEKIKSWEDIKNWTLEDLEDFKEFFGWLFLPGIYRSKTMKESLKKLVMLNKMAHELTTKKIPYGEATDHYNTLIENLSLATSIQADLKKRMS